MEIHDEEQIDQHHRERESPAQADERLVHGLRLPAQDDGAAAWQFLFRRGDERLDVVEHAAEIAPAHAAEDVDDGHDVVVRNDGQAAAAGERGDIGEHLTAADVAGRGADGDVAERVERIHGVLGRAGVDDVADAVAGIDEIAGVHLRAAAERGEDVVGDVALSQADLGGGGAVHGEAQLRLIRGLLHADIDRAGHLPDALGEPRGDGAIFRRLTSDDLHVKRRGQAEAECLADDVGGEKIERRAGKIAVQPQAQVADGFRDRMMRGLERDHHVGVAGADEAGV